MLIGQVTGLIADNPGISVTNNVLASVSTGDLEQLAALAAEAREAHGLPDPILATLETLDQGPDGPESLESGN